MQKREMENAFKHTENRSNVSHVDPMSSCIDNSVKKKRNLYIKKNVFFAFAPVNLCHFRRAVFLEQH